MRTSGGDGERCASHTGSSGAQVQRLAQPCCYRRRRLMDGRDGGPADGPSLAAEMRTGADPNDWPGSLPAETNISRHPDRLDKAVQVPPSDGFTVKVLGNVEDVEHVDTIL
jgi:hypothetical protein